MASTVARIKRNTAQHNPRSDISGRIIKYEAIDDVILASQMMNDFRTEPPTVLRIAIFILSDEFDDVAAVATVIQKLPQRLF